MGLIKSNLKYFFEIFLFPEYLPQMIVNKQVICFLTNTKYYPIFYYSNTQYDFEIFEYFTKIQITKLFPIMNFLYFLIYNLYMEFF